MFCHIMWCIWMKSAISVTAVYHETGNINWPQHLISIIIIIIIHFLEYHTIEEKPYLHFYFFFILCVSLDKRKQILQIWGLYLFSKYKKPVIEETIFMFQRTPNRIFSWRNAEKFIQIFTLFYFLLNHVFVWRQLS